MPPVLLVENDISIRRLICLILTRAGHRVAEVPDGRSALDWMRSRGEPAVVLLPTTMPTSSVAALIQAAGEQIGGQPHSCVLLTAVPESLPEPLRPLLSAHDVPVVGPPFAAADLLEAVEHAARRTHQPGGVKTVAEPED
jgi:CheY-like chemotaxis protein